MRNLKLWAIIAPLIICFSIYILYRQFKTNLPAGQAYFYNLQTKSLFTASDRLLSPIDTPSGPGTGVQAYVFRCNGSTDPNAHFIAYLEKMTPEGKAAAEQELKTDRSPAAMGFFMDKHPDAILVRNLQDETWYLKSSPAGAAAMSAGLAAGGCDHPEACVP